MQKITNANGLIHYQNPDWGNDIKHGFFTRLGGVSKGIYQGLNCGLGSDDDRRAILQNQFLACQALDADMTVKNLHEKLHTVFQYHSAKVIQLPLTDAHTLADNKRVRADAMVARVEDFAGKFMAIMTADCTPILFYEKQAGIIGAAHAGWKGAISGIIENTVSAIIAMGGAGHHIKIAIGPTIGQSSYQIGAEFYQQFLTQDSGGKDCFIKDLANADKYYFDLPKFVNYRLQKLGMDVDNISDCGLDTYQNDNLFFSYRRSCHQKQADYGRNFSMIGI